MTLDHAIGNRVNVQSAKVSVEHLCVECVAAHWSQFEVGGLAIQLAGDMATVDNLGPALELFRVAGRRPDIQVHVDRSARLVADVGRPLFDSGTTWRLYDVDEGFRFDFISSIFGDTPYKRLIVDRSFRYAVLLVNEQSLERFPSTASLLEYPLDELLIMHRLTQEKAIELHGTGIVRPNGEANLFVGHSGAGKSTTTRLWTAVESVEVLSDDRIIVRSDKLLPRSMRMYGTPWHGEAMYASPNSAPLSRIFILEHGHGNVLTPLSPSQAVGELFARSFVPFHRHEYVDAALQFLEELVDAVPVYHFAFEPDHRAVETIHNLHD